MRYLIPYVHYIPLAPHSVNISEVLAWTRAHPLDVKRIADAGRAFYDANLAPTVVAANYRYFFERLHDLLQKNVSHYEWLGALVSSRTNIR